MEHPADLTWMDDVPVVELFGELDLANAAQLRRCFQAAAADAARAVVVSLMHADYFDSSTIHTLVSFDETLRAQSGRLFVVGPSGDSGRRILSIFGLAARTPVFETLPDAIASAREFNANPSPARA